MARLGLLLLVVGVLAGCDVSRPSWQTEPASCEVVLGGAQVWLEDTCASWGCAVELVQRGCRLDVEVDLCGGEALQLELSGAGLPQSASRGGVRCEPLASDALGRWQCGECTATLHRATEPEALELQFAQVDDRPPHLPSGFLSQPLDGFGPLSGWLADMLPLQTGQVLVARHADDADDLTSCNREAPSTLDWIDAETLLVTRTATAPACLTRLAPDVAGGFFAAFGGAAPSLGRFSRQGALVETFALQVPPTSRPAFVTALLVDEARIHVVLTSRGDPKVGLAGTLARDGGANLGWVTMEDSLLRAAILDAGRVLATDRIGGYIYALQPELGMAQTPTNLFDLLRRSDDAGSLLMDGLGRLLVGSTGQRSALFILQVEGAAFERGPVVPFFERPAVPWAMATWSAAPEEVMVGVTAEGPGAEASLARFHPETGRYLPGAARIGYGVVSRLIEGPRGDLWALLPWQGRVVRVRAPR